MSRYKPAKTNPQIEEPAQVVHTDYKVYKRRWVVLLSAFTLILVGSLHRSLICIADIFNTHVNITIREYDLIQQVCMLSTLLPVMLMARLLDRFGLRKMMYAATSIVICANLLKALCCADESIVPPWVHQHRYLLLILSEACVGLASSIHTSFPAKIASVWFPHRESTLALVLTGCGYNVGIALSNYLTPVFVESVNDMNKMSYMFLVSAAVLSITTPLCITRSKPKSPPSANAIASESTSVPLGRGILVMLSNPSYCLLMLKMATDLTAISVVQINLQDVLSKQHYSDSFCGILIAHGYFFGIFFSIIGATFVDNASNYILVSRITSIVYSVTLAVFYVSLLLPDIALIIVATNIVAALGISVMTPAATQLSLRSAITILPEASVSALLVILCQSSSTILLYFMEPLKSLSRNPGEYDAPILILVSAVVVINLAFALFFRMPNRFKLQNKLKTDNVTLSMSTGFLRTRSS